MSVTVTNSPIQDYVHQDDHIHRTYRKSSIKPPGVLLISNTFEEGGGLNRDGVRI